MAAQLLALALDARRHGDITYSELLTVRASEHLDRAQEMEGPAPVAPSSPSPNPGPVQQQQQQPQPQKKEG